MRQTGIGSRGGRYRKYTDKFRAGALELLAASTRPSMEARYKEVATHLKMPAETLETWHTRGIKSSDPIAKAEIAELQMETHKELVELFDTEVRAVFLEMVEKREDATYKDLTIALGIMTDKLQLLNDKPTQNVQQAISFTRQGISTLPEHLTPETAISVGAEEAV